MSEAAAFRALNRLDSSLRQFRSDGNGIFEAEFQFFPGQPHESIVFNTCNEIFGKGNWRVVKHGWSQSCTVNEHGIFPGNDAAAHYTVERIERLQFKSIPEIVRVNGRMICEDCGKKYHDHPNDPVFPWPTFYLLCDGTHIKC